MAFTSGAIHDFGGAISSSGPNSGHTSYLAGEKIVLKQLPTFAVISYLLGRTIPVYLSAGAVIDPDVLTAEAMAYPKIPIFIHPNAAVVTPAEKETEQSGTIRDIASTQSGTGAALANKIFRRPDAIMKHHMGGMPSNTVLLDHRIRPEREAYFVEVAQGFSLGINSRFYPHVTSRECTVMQALADARIAPRWLRKVFTCFRTYPIRVGNLGEHSSGDWYGDQTEMTWEELKVAPELTTVTKRIRRVANFSADQFEEAIIANDPDWIAINFMNYFDEANQSRFHQQIRDMRDEYEERFKKWFGIIGGYGPEIKDWRII
jgi:adenylosuccinate synthase